MDTQAAVAFEAGQPLSSETVQLDGPRAGEVMVEIRATGICHTDAYTLSGLGSGGALPRHHGARGRRRRGRGWREGVTSLEAVGDHVIPLYTPECRQCKYCLSGKTNLCGAIRVDPGAGPDARRRPAASP